MNNKTPEQKADEYVESKLKGFGGRCIEREYYENGLTLGYEAGYKAAKEEAHDKVSCMQIALKCSEVCVYTSERYLLKLKELMDGHDLSRLIDQVHEDYEKKEVNDK